MCRHGQVAEALENALGLLEELWLGLLSCGGVCDHWRFELQLLRLHTFGCKFHRKCPLDLSGDSILPWKIPTFYGF